MRDVIKKYEIWIFLILAPIVNTFITLANSEGYIKGFVYTHGRFYVLMLLLMGIVLFTRGKTGIKEIFKPMLKWKISIKWYVFSLLFALTIGTLTLLIKALYNGEDYFSLLRVHFPSLKDSLVLLTWAFMGEVVWVSYSIKTLSKTLKPFIASQIIGFVWALWWVPSVLVNHGVILDLPLWPLFLNMMGAAGMCTFIYWKTRSGICVWLLQYMLNMSLLILPVSPKTGGINTYATFASVYFLVMLVFMYFAKPKKIDYRKPVLAK